MFDLWGLLASLAFLAALVCHILVIVKMFQAGQTVLAILCIVLLFCFCIGFFITLIYGWMKAKEWNINTLMLVYTVALVAYLASTGANAGKIQTQIQEYQKQK